MRFLPDLTGTGPLVAELATDLARLGENVTVITSVPHYGRVPGASPEGRSKRDNREDGVRVVRTPAFPLAPGSVAGRSIDYALYSTLSALAGIAAQRPDVVLAIAPPLSAGLSGWVIGGLRRAPLVFNTQDIWPDGLVRMGSSAMDADPQRSGLSGSRIAAPEGRRLVRRDAGQLLQKGVPLQKIAVLPNWVDARLGRRGRRLRATRPGDSFVVLFAGNLGFAAGLETVLGAADLLRQEPIVFLLVGEGSAKPEAMRLTQTLGLPNVRFVTTQPPERLSQVFRAADVSLVTLRSGMGALSVPSKTMAIMASGRTVLAAVPEDSDVRRVVGEAEAGRCIDPEDPAAMAEAILALRSDRARLESYGSNGRRYVAAHFDRADIVGRYHRLLQDVAAGKAS
jgi:colanic acid biosynthesis glycosyl transferase WcaI